MNKKSTNRIVVVLGMHRSGTSALTRGLNVLGVDLGQSLLKEMPDNPKGFWEDKDINDLNIRMLNYLVMDWKSLKYISNSECEELINQGFLDEAHSLIQHKLASGNIFGFKDPRIAKLLNFWLVVFEKINADVNYVISIRNPLSVASSLISRNNLSKFEAYVLWLEHVYNSLVMTEGFKRTIVDYDDFIVNTSRTIVRISEEFELKVSPNKLKEFESDFIDADLRHTHYALDDLKSDKECPAIIIDIYEKLLQQVVYENSVNFKYYYGEWGHYISSIKPFLTLAEEKRQIYELNAKKQDILLNNIELLKEQNDEQVRHNSKYVERIKQLENSLDTIINSKSWKLTSPLRFIIRLFKHGLTHDDRRKLLTFSKNKVRKLPLPNSFRKVLSSTYYKLENQQVIKLNENIYKSDNLKSNLDNSPDYIVWGVIDWHFRYQRPQHIALQISKENRRVFYVSPHFIDNKTAGFSAELLNSEKNLFQIKLYLEGAPQIYDSAPSFEQVEQLRQSVAKVISWAESYKLINIVDHPYWLDIASYLPNSKLVYDCMDFHDGFGNNAESLQQLERSLYKEANLTVTTSSWLYEAVKEHSSSQVLIRNACDYEHFSSKPEVTFRDKHNRKIIGYYGAIAEWFDLGLVTEIAKSNPDKLVLLIGNDTVAAEGRLSDYNNIMLIGEVSYNDLPYYLYSFDVCLLPFKITPLTLATNPVKVYEYLCSGKPIVCVDLPEMSQFSGLIEVGKDTVDFLKKIDGIFNKEESESIIAERRKFASEQTWHHRAKDLMLSAEADIEKDTVSIIVVTFNNLDLTKDCLLSLDKYSEYKNKEIIVVDNDSQDGTPDYLKAWVKEYPEQRKIILNNDNKGFSAANNQGLQIAKGDYLVLLNNDTYVTPGWISGLKKHLDKDKTIGLVGPVTNNIGNEAKISISYNNMDEMLIESKKYTLNHIGKEYPLRTAAFFCIMISRKIYEEVGLLDEIFGKGFFEDDDYCRRIEKQGYRIVCAEDVFIHHHLSASFDKLKHKKRMELFENNKEIYEKKWGEWVPHKYR